MHHGKQKTQEEYKTKLAIFNYGALGKIPIFKKSHPNVMTDFMNKIYWTKDLNYTKKCNLTREKMKHEKCKYRFITFLENTFNKGRDFFGYSNWNEVSK